MWKKLRWMRRKYDIWGEKRRYMRKKWGIQGTMDIVSRIKKECLRKKWWFMKKKKGNIKKKRGYMREKGWYMKKKKCTWVSKGGDWGIKSLFLYFPEPLLLMGSLSQNIFINQQDHIHPKRVSLRQNKYSYNIFNVWNLNESSQNPTPNTSPRAGRGVKFWKVT